MDGISMQLQSPRAAPTSSASSVAWTTGASEAASFAKNTDPSIPLDRFPFVEATSTSGAPGASGVACVAETSEAPPVASLSARSLGDEP